MSYCPKCGVLCTETETGVYDVNKGNSIMRSVCPSGLCGHLNIPHKWKYYFWKCCDICQKCGVKDYGGSLGND